MRCDTRLAPDAGVAVRTARGVTARDRERTRSRRSCLSHSGASARDYATRFGAAYSVETSRRPPTSSSAAQPPRSPATSPTPAGPRLRGFDHLARRFLGPCVCCAQPLTRRQVLPGRATATLQPAASRQRLAEQSGGITGSSARVFPWIRKWKLTGIGGPSSKPYGMTSVSGPTIS
jgi:hypothetical protein